MPSDHPGWGGRRDPPGGRPPGSKNKPIAEVPAVAERVGERRAAISSGVRGVHALEQILAWFMGEAVREQQKGAGADRAVIAGMLREARSTANMLSPYQDRKLAVLQIQGDPLNPLVHAFDPAALAKLTEAQLEQFATLLALITPAWVPPADADGDRGGARTPPH